MRSVRKLSAKTEGKIKSVRRVKKNYYLFSVFCTIVNFHNLSPGRSGAGRIPSNRRIEINPEEMNHVQALNAGMV